MSRGRAETPPAAYRGCFRSEWDFESSHSLGALRMRCRFAATSFLLGSCFRPFTHVVAVVAIGGLGTTTRTALDRERSGACKDSSLGRSIRAWSQEAVDRRTKARRNRCKDTSAANLASYLICLGTAQIVQRTRQTYNQPTGRHAPFPGRTGPLLWDIRLRHGAAISKRARLSQIALRRAAEQSALRCPPLRGCGLAGRSRLRARALKAISFDTRINEKHPCAECTSQACQHAREVEHRSLAVLHRAPAPSAPRRNDARRGRPRPGAV
jgi:hypothetical protein